MKCPHNLINAVIARALHDTFHPRFVIETEVGKGREKMDVCLLNAGGSVVAAIEGKMMVSNGTSKRASINPIEIHGIKTKLNGKQRSVAKDIIGIEGKVATTGLVVPHYEIFVPIVYELYRSGGEDEWALNSKPWTTPTEFMEIRNELRSKLTQWFRESDKRIIPLYSTNPIELIDADHFWQEQSAWLYPEYSSLKAYVSFFAFGRYV